MRTILIPMLLVWCVPAMGDVIYVNANAPGPRHNGTTWDYAFLAVQQGCDAAAPGDEVWVAKGTYNEYILLDGRHLYGGFEGTETALDQRKPRDNETILQGGASQTWSQWVFSVLYIKSGTVDGFTIRSGSGVIEPWIYSSVLGGGIYATGSCVIRNNVIEGNSACVGDGNGRSQGAGGGLYAKEPVTVEHNIFRHNSADTDTAMCLEKGGIV